jgi:putative FmdB family regulatory protein
MPVYEFLCKHCNAIDEVKRPAAEAREEYRCPDCDSVCQRHYSAPNVITQGEQVKYFHPAFGKVMSDLEARREAKARGLIEVGNEDQSKHISPPETNYDEPDYFDKISLKGQI